MFLRPRFLRSVSASGGGRGKLSTVLPENLTHQRLSGRKRFYKEVGIVPLVAECGTPAGFNITLDGTLRIIVFDYIRMWTYRISRVFTTGKTLRTPARRTLKIPNIELALAVSAEWDAQVDPHRGLEPVSMPLTQASVTSPLLNTSP